MGDVKRAPGRLTAGNNWAVLVVESTKQPSGGWVHKECGTEIMGKEVYLSQRDGVSPFSGSGEARSEVVPYCPECEREPRGGTFGAGGIQIDS